MADNVENLVLEHLRALRAGQDRIESELRDLKERVSAVETGLNGVRRDLVALAEADARLQVTIDRLGDRVDRIEKRLELRENP
jgi:predicted  nucleic acid-binding Zn-ribbon protein